MTEPPDAAEEIAHMLEGVQGVDDVDGESPHADEPDWNDDVLPDACPPGEDDADYVYAEPEKLSVEAQEELYWQAVDEAGCKPKGKP
ncbi:MAG TPA: hypothetical protein PLD73_17470 [Candidatus Hydrogenedentes bacterium]|nr:hypothetical protein [Candidatus Hydrogenedentota bacterium]